MCFWLCAHARGRGGRASAGGPGAGRGGAEGLRRGHAGADGRAWYFRARGGGRGSYVGVQWELQGALCGWERGCGDGLGLSSVRKAERRTRRERPGRPRVRPTRTRCAAGAGGGWAAWARHRGDARLGVRWERVRERQELGRLGLGSGLPEVEPFAADACEPGEPVRVRCVRRRI